MVLGVLGVFYGFYESHKYQTVEDVKVLLASEHHEGDYAGGNAQAGDSHGASHAAENGMHSGEEHAEGHEMSHEEHVLHQIHNRPYAAMYVGGLFLLYDCIGCAGFLCHSVCRSGRLVLRFLFRVMEAITSYVLPGALIVFALALIADKHIFCVDGPRSCGT